MIWHGPLYPSRKSLAFTRQSPRRFAHKRLLVARCHWVLHWSSEMRQRHFGGALELEHINNVLNRRNLLSLLRKDRVGLAVNIQYTDVSV